MGNGWRKYYALKVEFDDELKYKYYDYKKELVGRSGIYIWTRVEQDKTYFYIGQAKDLYKRYFQYFLIKCGVSYPKRHFEASLKKHRDGDFQVLQYVEPELLDKQEKHGIDIFMKQPNYITRNEALTGDDGIVRINSKKIERMEQKLIGEIRKNVKHLERIKTGNGITLTPYFTKKGEAKQESIKALNYLNSLLFGDDNDKNN